MIHEKSFYSTLRYIILFSGTEFIGNRNYFEEKKIYFRTKRGQHKAAFAEHGIYLVKRRLYTQMRTTYSQNWPKFLPLITQAVNNTKNPAIGNLRPADITSPLQDPLIDEAIGFPAVPSIEEFENNQKTYEKSRFLLQVGNYVYADEKEGKDAFYKSFDVQVTFSNTKNKVPNSFRNVFGILFFAFLNLGSPTISIVILIAGQNM